MNTRLDHNDHDHAHHHINPAELGEKGLVYATAANIGLTFVQVAGGLLAGSLAVLADALHNFGDACILILALVALKIGQRPADERRTFGYKRAENVAALISLTSLIIVGVFLIMEAVSRFYKPQEVIGSIMIGVTCFALIVDLWTVWLTHRAARHSSNIRAAFLHNMMDALASIGVIIGGVLILLYGWDWVDIVITIAISLYAMYFALKMMKTTIHLLMDGVPKDINVGDVALRLERIDDVEDVHHIHIRRLNDHDNAFEGHIRICDTANMDQIKHEIKRILRDEFGIGHSTLEFEIEHCCD